VTLEVTLLDSNNKYSTYYSIITWKHTLFYGYRHLKKLMTSLFKRQCLGFYVMKKKRFKLKIYLLFILKKKITPKL